MQSYQDLRSVNREVKKFYDKICPQLNDLEINPDENLELHDDAEISPDTPEEKLYGKITNEEFEKILDSYKKQQESGGADGKPVTCDTVAGRNYSKLLYSKPGFHHLGSTAYLVQDLAIKNIDRNTFLGGHSTYSLREGEDIAGLKKNNNRILIKQNVKKAHEHLDRKEFDFAQHEIDKSLKIDPKNGDVLAARGRYHDMTNKCLEAIEDFKAALSNKAEDINLVNTLLSDSLYRYGMKLYNRSEWQKAMAFFTQSVKYNTGNEGAKLHFQLCQDKIQSQTPFTSKSHLTYRK